MCIQLALHVICHITTGKERGRMLISIPLAHIFTSFPGHCKCLRQTVKSNLQQGILVRNPVQFMACNRYFKCRKCIFVGVEKGDKVGDNLPFQGSVHILRTYPLYKLCNMCIAAFVYVHSNLKPSSLCSIYSNCKKQNKSKLGPSPRNLHIQETSTYFQGKFRRVFLRDLKN